MVAPFTLRAKFLYGLLSLMVLFALLSITFIQTILRDRLSVELQKRGISIAKHFAEVSANPFLTETVVSVEMLAEDYLKKEEDLEYIFALNHRQEVVAHTFGKAFPVELLSVNRLQHEQPYGVRFLTTEKGKILDIAAPILHGELGEVHVGVSFASIDKGIANVIGLSTWIMIGMVAAGCLYIYFFITAITRPIRVLTAGVEAVGSGDLARRITVDTNDEIGQLAASFNKMTESLRSTTVSKEYMDKLINTMNDALVVLTPENRITSCNRAFRVLLGYEDDELVGRLIDDCLSGMKLLTRQEYEALFANGFLNGVEKTLLTRNRNTVPILTSMAVMYDEEGYVQGIICAAQDMASLKRAETELQLKQRELEELNRNLEQTVESRTQELAKANVELKQEIAERSRAEAEMRIAKETAEVASRAKSEFLANMSHEIRTPLNAVMGMADLLAESSLSFEQQGYIQILQRSGGNLLQLINDILDLSKVEAGVMEIEAVEFDLEDLLDRTCELLAVRAHEKGLELSCHIGPDVPTLLVGDPNRLRQVLVNLIGNAVKFTERGDVLLQVTSQAVAGDVAELAFSVKDTGIGIPDEKISNIFDIFAQADSSTTRKYGGSGLGLAISKRLVKLMGGEITVSSKTGEGSTFTFTIRSASQAILDESARRAMVDLYGVRVLVVDDNSINRFIIRELLSRYGAEVIEAENGEGALAELRKSVQCSNPFRLLLLDCRMPVMDGFQVVEQIREDPQLKDAGKMAVLMLTSDNRAGDIARVLDLGIGCYLVKPVKRLEMLDAVSRTISEVGRPAVSTSPTRNTSDGFAVKKQRILLVEDTQDNRLLIKAFLKNSGFITDEAENGAVAVEKFSSDAYDLILMDMQMPVMDGYAATKEIRRIERQMNTGPVPIIALTAYAFEEDVKKSLAAGCDHHLSKPVKKVDLLDCIGKYVEGVAP